MTLGHGESFGHCGFLRGGEGGNPLRSRNGKQSSHKARAPQRWWWQVTICGPRLQPWDANLDPHPSSKAALVEGYDRMVVQCKAAAS